MSFTYNPFKLRNALDNLRKACVVSQEDMDVSRAVEAFKFSYELLWRLLRRIVEDEGYNAATPQRAFHCALELGIAQNPPLWKEAERIRHDLGSYLENTPPEKIAADFLAFCEEATLIIAKLEEPAAA